MKIRLRTEMFYRKVKLDQLAELSFVLFFSDALLRTFFVRILGESAISSWIGILVPYIPLVVICIKEPKKYIKLDFIVLLTGIIVFFVITLLVHPEYEFHYIRNDYGVLDHVLKPHRGIYAFLFIRLIGEPKRILNCMKNAGWLMMIYFSYKIYKADWTVVTATGYNVNASYSVSFGYEVLIFALFFLFLALTEKKKRYFIAAIIDIMFIFIGGSRGPILFIGIFLVLYILIYIQNAKNKEGIILLIASGGVLVYLFYIPILLFFQGVLEKYNLSSRFIRMMLAGTISDDSNRSIIWNAALDMVKNNPFGYGAMGSRHVIYNYIYSGYPHSIILEFLIDYGVLLGSVLLFILFGYSLSILFSKEKREWCAVFLPFFCAACSMFVSLTYWSRPEFWACLQIGLCCFRDMKHKKGKRVLVSKDKRF